MLWPRWIWLRALGLIFLSVFYSLAFQIEGLVGPRGILPAGEYLPEVREAVGAWKAAWYAPTLFWLGSSDGALLAVTLLGAADPPSRFAVFMLLWEWFRIYFESGVVKLLSGDAQWRNFTALDHYYENGPLPSWIGWYVQELLPHWFHAACEAVVFAVELALVWLAFLPRRWRIACFLLVSPFQAIIILTANYAFLNYIVLCLGVLLLDDRFLARAGLAAPDVPLPRANWPARIALGWIFGATLVIAPGVARTLPRPLLWPARALEPFRIANRYGLFAVMTEGRYEIEFQGSRDGIYWTPYVFRYKPQDLMTAPGIYAPYQPRFEWNLWFASLGDWRAYPWVARAERRLLEGAA